MLLKHENHNCWVVIWMIWSLQVRWNSIWPHLTCCAKRNFQKMNMFFWWGHRYRFVSAKKMCGVLCLQFFFFAIGYPMFYPLKKVAFTWEISHVTNVHSPRVTELRRSRMKQLWQVRQWFCLGSERGRWCSYFTGTALKMTRKFMVVSLFLKNYIRYNALGFVLVSDFLQIVP